MRKIIKIGITIVVLGAVIAAIYLFDPLPANPSSEQLSKAASQYSVEIIRDDWGVPHVFGNRDVDVSFGLAYAHAEDDYATIQEVLAATRGVLAQYRGRDAAVTDYIVSFMGIWSILDAEYESLPEDVKAMAEAYAAGLNLYASHNPDTTWQGLAPFSERDVIAGFMFKTPFFYGFDKVLAEVFAENRQSELALNPSSKSEAFVWRKNSGQELGSNAIAVNATRSGEGITRLLINSHQPMTGPVAWYEARLVSNEGLDITGGLFPGTPVILHGFNKNLAWANTVNHIDLVDTYQLKVNPENPKQYLLDDQWLDFEAQKVTIKVKLMGPFYFNAKREVLRSRHGPVAVNGTQHIAVRYAGMNEIRQFEQYYRLNKSENFEEFIQAMSMNALPSINYLYADRNDNIAFIHNAQYPKRLPSWEWQKDLPGDRSELIWKDYLPFEAVPKLVNPRSGFLFNANNSPFQATDGGDNLQADDFPLYMGLATDYTNRARRLIELTDGETAVDKDALLALKFDNRYSEDSKYYSIIKKVLALDLEDTNLVKAQHHLSQWNRATDRANRHAALAVITMRKVVRGDDPEDYSNANLKRALQAAQSHLLDQYGRIDPQWGEVNRLVRGDFNQAVAGGPDVLRAIYSLDELEDGRPFATHGDTWMAIVEWDELGQQSAEVLHQFGTSTSNENSPHYNDQAQLFVDQKWRTAILDKNILIEKGFQPYRPYERKPQSMINQ